jgi:hypothetical protein
MAPKQTKIKTKVAKAPKAKFEGHKGAVTTADPHAEAAAKAAAEKRTPFVKDCQSCKDWAAHHTNHLPCGHDQKK